MQLRPRQEHESSILFGPGPLDDPGSCKPCLAVTQGQTYQCGHLQRRSPKFHSQYILVKKQGSSPAVQWLTLHASTAGGVVLVPG